MDSSFTEQQLATLANLVTQAVQSASSSLASRAPAPQVNPQRAPQPSTMLDDLQRAHQPQQDHQDELDVPSLVSSRASARTSRHPCSTEFVEAHTSSYPPSPSRRGEPATKRVRVTTADSDDGITIASVGPQRRKLHDLTSWLESWTIYAGAVVAWAPDRATELFGLPGGHRHRLPQLQR